MSGRSREPRRTRDETIAIEDRAQRLAGAAARDVLLRVPGWGLVDGGAVIHETSTCAVCGNPFSYVRLTKPRTICSYQCERKARGHGEWNSVRRKRVAALRAIGYSSVERDAAAGS